ncbi:MAG: type IV toxin-antitoxin system AbiEi family antitoxin domain-containing protein [bacterium]
MKKSDLIQAFKNNGGWLHSRSFGYKTHIYKYLKELIQQGEVEEVKRGLFYYKKLNPVADSFNEIAILYPNAVICLFSAWHYYQLTTTVPYRHHLAIPHKSKPAKTDYPPVKFYYWSKEQYELGMVKQNKLMIYDVEKSVCDAVKFRNKVGEEITLEVLKKYMKLKQRDIEKLMGYAKQMRIEKTISPMLKTLI